MRYWMSKKIYYLGERTIKQRELRQKLAIDIGFKI